MPETAEATTIGAKPIPGANPCGEKATYEDEYTAVKAEIEKLQAVSGDKPNWNAVVSNATTLLTDKSKDLQIACFLVTALNETKGYFGLAEGLQILVDMVKTYWEGMQPSVKKERARASSLNWMDENLGKAIEKKSSASEKFREPLTNAQTALKELKTLINEKFKEEKPGLGDLVRAVDGKINSIPKPKAAPAPGEEKPRFTEGPAEAPKAEINSAESAKEALKTINKDLEKIAKTLLEADSSDPDSYRINRWLAWTPVVDYPENEEGKLKQGGPDEFAAKGFEKQITEEKFEELLKEIEPKVAGNPFWLDLHLFVVRALEGLGRTHRKAAAAVRGSLGGLLARHPGLETFTFANNMPLASDATRVWIDSEVLGTGGDGDDEKLTQALAAAKKLVSRKKLVEGAQVLLDGLKTVPERRDRFIWRLEIARICVDGGKSELALPQLEALDDEIEKFSLQEWEPALAVQVVELLWKCCSKAKDKDTQDKAQKLYERLCRMDLGAALSVDGKKKKK